MTGDVLLFYLFAAATCLGAVMVVVSQNVVRMAFWLIVSLGSSAGLFFLLHADFVAATQLLIYVGGTLVLLVFGVMLTASDKHMKITTHPAEGFLAAGIGVMFLAMLVGSITAVDWSNADQAIRIGTNATVETDGYNEAGTGNTLRPVGLGLIGIRVDKDLGNATGQLSTGYLLPFEIASIHLLVVLVGAAYLARAKRRNEAAGTEG